MKPFSYQTKMGTQNLENKSPKDRRDFVFLVNRKLELFLHLKFHSHDLVINISSQN